MQVHQAAAQMQGTSQIWSDGRLFYMFSIQLTMIHCRIPVPIKSSHSVSRRIHVHKHEQPDPLQRDVNGAGGLLPRGRRPVQG